MRSQEQKQTPSSEGSEKPKLSWADALIENFKKNVREELSEEAREKEAS